MATPDSIRSLIREAFASGEYPGDGRLSNSREGDEPFLVEQEFRGKSDWRTIDAAFLDQAPDGFGTALSFFSDEAFRFYLPAYLIADIDGLLQHADPVFHLTHGLERGSARTKINPRRYGERTWADHALHKFSMFNRQERAAIAAYLAWKRDSQSLTELEKDRIDDALDRFWARAD